MSWSISGQPKTLDGHKFQRGQTLVIVAILLVALVAMLALAIDLGVAYSQRRVMQNAADAGALAGARALALTVPRNGAQDAAAEAAARAAVDKYTKVLNQADSFEAVIASPYVTVTAHKSNPTFFARIIGIPQADVSAVAAARFLPAAPLSFMPLTIIETLWVPGQMYKVFDDRKGSPVLGELDRPEMRGWLNLDGGSANADELECWICPWEKDCPPLPKIYVPEGADGVWVNSASGGKTKDLKAIDRCLKGKTVPVPIFRSTCERGEAGCPDVGTGTINYYIVGFANFRIDAVKDKGDPKYVEGTFESTSYVLSDVSGDEDLEDFGLRVVKLVR